MFIIQVIVSLINITWQAKCYLTCEKCLAATGHIFSPFLALSVTSSPVGKTATRCPSILDISHRIICR